MTPNEYQKLARRTDKKEYNNLPLSYPYNKLVHAHFGLSSEVGEIGDALKKHFIYGQPLDVENIAEECGDILWYMALMLDSLQIDMEEVMESNIAKLSIRYPSEFTEELAKERKDKK